MIFLSSLQLGHQNQNPIFGRESRLTYFAGGSVGPLASPDDDDLFNIPAPVQESINSGQEVDTLDEIIRKGEGQKIINLQWQKRIREYNYLNACDDKIRAVARYMSQPDKFRARQEMQNELLRYLDENGRPKDRAMYEKLRKARDKNILHLIQAYYREIRQEKENLKQLLIRECYFVLKKRIALLKKNLKGNKQAVEKVTHVEDYLQGAWKIAAESNNSKKNRLVREMGCDPAGYDDLKILKELSQIITSYEAEVQTADYASTAKKKMQDDPELEQKIADLEKKLAEGKIKLKDLSADDRMLLNYKQNLVGFSLDDSTEEYVPDVNKLREKLVMLKNEDKKTQFMREYQIAMKRFFEGEGKERAIKEILLETRGNIVSNPHLKDEKGPDGLSEREKHLKHMDAELEKLKELEGLPDKIFGPNGIKKAEDMIKEALVATNPADKKSNLLNAEKLINVLEEFLNNPQAIANSATRSLTDSKKYASQFREPLVHVEKREIIWLSFAGLEELFWKIPSEWAERRVHNAEAREVGEVGHHILKHFPWEKARSLAHDFYQQQQSKELEEVGVFEKAYENVDPWDLLKLLEHPTHKDQLRALLTVLAKKGYLRIDQPIFWKALMKYQKEIWFDVDEPDNELCDLEKLISKLHKAVGYIWDFELFFSWKQSQDGKYQDLKKSFEKEAHGLSEKEGGGLAVSLTEMLIEWNKAKDEGRGMDSKVNMHRYEEFVEYTLQRGKLSPEAKIYYMIQGFASGLIPWDRLAYFDAEYLNLYPCLEVFAEGTIRGKRPTIDDIKDWAKIDAHKCKPGHQFNTWYWTYVMTLPKVQQRINKAFTEKTKVDHDDATAFTAQADIPALRQVLDQSFGAHAQGITMYQNMAVSFLQYMDNIAVNHQYFNTTSLPLDAELARGISSFLFFDGIVEDRIGRNEKFQKFDENTLRKNPRSNEYYARGDDDLKDTEVVQSTRGYLEKTQNLVKKLDKFFEADPQIHFPLMKELIGLKEDTNEKQKVETICNAIKNISPNIFGKDKDTPTTAKALIMATPAILGEIFRLRPHLLNQFFDEVKKDLNRHAGKDRVSAMAVNAQYQDIYQKKPAWRNPPIQTYPQGGTIEYEGGGQGGHGGH